MQFIYVMHDEDKNKLTELGYKLLKEDCKNNIWVFANKKEEMRFSNTDILKEKQIPHITSSILTF